jgi:transposase
MPITHFTLESLADISLMKTLRSQKLRMLLVHRKLLQSKSIAIENDLRGTLRNFELKVGVAGTAKFEARIR